ncbi:MAG: hypothetical protein SGBAC_009203 [Bacillariaceae sp.]
MPRVSFSGDVEASASAEAEKGKKEKSSAKATNILKDVAEEADDDEEEVSVKPFSRDHRAESMQHARRSSYRKSMRVSIKSKVTWARRATIKLFGDEYSTKEGIYVLFAGAWMAFNTGYVNGSCLSGLVSYKGTGRTIAGFTSSYTQMALYVGAGDGFSARVELGIILCYFLGAFLSGCLTPRATPFRIQPSYGPTFLIGGTFMLASSVLAANEVGDLYIFRCAAAAAGVQNGVASIFSANLIRTALGGSTTDIAIVLGQVLRGNRKEAWKGLVLLVMVLNFWFGGVIAYYSTRHFQKKALFFATALFFFIGLSLVVFLVKELHVSVGQAIFGTWEWRSKLRKLTESHRKQRERDSDAGTTVDHEQALNEIFDDLDLDGNGVLDANEVLVGLQAAGVSTNMQTVLRLINLADADNDGFLDRKEWAKIATVCFGMKGSSL